MDVGCGAVKQTDALQERVTASPGGGPRASRDEAGQHSTDAQSRFCKRLFVYAKMYAIMTPPLRYGRCVELIILTIFRSLLLSQLLRLFPLHRKFSQLTLSAATCIYYVFGKLMRTVLWS